MLKGSSFICCVQHNSNLENQRLKYYDLEMEERHSSSDFNQKNIVFSVQEFSGDANLTFALFYLSTDYEFVIYCHIKQVLLNDTGDSKNT